MKTLGMPYSAAMILAKLAGRKSRTSSASRGLWIDMLCLMWERARKEVYCGN